MPLFSQLKYNNYVPQYVGMPLDEFYTASGAVQNRYNQTAEGYSLIGELAESLQHSPLAGDKEAKMQLMGRVNSEIEAAAARGDFDQMQNEMRKLAKDYAKMSTPIKENLARYQAAEKAIYDSKLPQNHINYLLNNLRSKPGLSYDQDGIPQYLQADAFAENVDLRDVYEKYINDYKSDKAPNGIYQVKDPVTGLVEYYANNTHERVDANDVRQGLQLLAYSDPKVQNFILQDAASNGQQINDVSQFIDYAAPLMEAYTQKAAFDKKDLEFKLGEAGGFRAKKKEEELGEGFTFDINWGIPARAGVATPSDLRKTREGLNQTRQTIVDDFNRFLFNNGDAIDPLTGKSKSGKIYKDEVDMFNNQLDGLDAQKWELQEIEQQAKQDAGLPANYTPNQKALDQAQAAYDKAIRDVTSSAEVTRFGKVYTEEELQKIGTDAYNKSLDNSNDPSLKAYRSALAKNAKDRTDVRGVTTFGKGTRAEMDVIGDRIVAGDWGFVKATDVATGRELEDLDEYGPALENIGWAINNGQVQLMYRTGERDGNKFVPSDKKISIQAPPELTNYLTEKGYIKPADLDIDRQIGNNGGPVKVGDLRAKVEIKRAAQNTPASVVVITNDNNRHAFPSRGKAIEFIRNLAIVMNGN